MSGSGGSLELEISVRGDVDDPEAELRVIGEFDRLQVDRFDRASTVLARERVRLTVDLTRTTIIDSAALGSLVRLRHALDRIGGELQVVVSTPFQVTVMEVGGLAEFLNVRKSDRDGPRENDRTRGGRDRAPRAES